MTPNSSQVLNLALYMGHNGVLLGNNAKLLISIIRFDYLLLNDHPYVFFLLLIYFIHHMLQPIYCFYINYAMIMSCLLSFTHFVFLLMFWLQRRRFFKEAIKIEFTSFIVK